MSLNKIQVASLMLVLTFWAVLPAGTAIAPAQAQDALSDTSLSFIPGDTTIYLSLMNNKSQFDAVVNSKAFAKLKEFPYVKSLFEGRPDAGLQQMQQFFESPQGQSLQAMLIDMFSDEVFIACGSGYVEMFELQKDFYEEMGDVAIEKMRDEARREVEGLDVDEDVDEENVALDNFGNDDEYNRMIFSVLNNNVDKLGVPETIIGFHLNDTESADQQLRMLELMGGQMLAQNPAMADRLERKKIGNTEYLTFHLDAKALSPNGQMVNQLIEMYEEEPGEFDQLKKKIQELTLTACLGIRDQHLLLYVGPDTTGLKQLGEEKLLSERAEFVPLREMADRKLASVVYVGDQLAVSGDHQINYWMKIASAALEQAEAPDEARQQARKDLSELGEDLLSLVPQPGNQLHLSTLTEKGYEAFTYSRTENRRLDGTRPLTNLQHVGQDPIFFLAGRSRYSLEGYQMLTKWVGKARYYVEQFGMQEMEPEDRGKFQQYVQQADPLLDRLDKTTREMFLPAFQDGQAAFVLDSKLRSKRWFEAMPPSSQPLPMLEPALVFGVSDAKLLKKACSEYVAIVNDVVAMVCEIAPDETEELEGFRVPLPSTKVFPGEGAFYWYRMPEEAGVNRRIVPTAGLSDEFLTLAITAKHARRLLKSETLSAGRLLSDTSQSAAVTAHFNWARLLDTISPWVDYTGEQLAGFPLFGGAPDFSEDFGEEFSDEEVDNQPLQVEGLDTESMLEQVHATLEILKCFRSYSSVTRVEDDTLVTHSEWYFQDLE